MLRTDPWATLRENLFQTARADSGFTKSLPDIYKVSIPLFGGRGGRCKSSQEVRVRRELILSTVSSATSASSISTSCWQLSLITYTIRPTQMKMRRIMPITWGVKKYKHTQCVFLNNNNPSHTLKGRSFHLDCVREGKKYLTHLRKDKQLLWAEHQLLWGDISFTNWLTPLLRSCLVNQYKSTLPVCHSTSEVLAVEEQQDQPHDSRNETGQGHGLPAPLIASASLNDQHQGEGHDGRNDEECWWKQSVPRRIARTLKLQLHQLL